MDLPLGKQRGQEDGQQDLHEREEIRVPHRRQIDEGSLGSDALSDALPEFIVFRANLLFTGMSRPFDSKCSELLHSDFDRAIDAVRVVSYRCRKPKTTAAEICPSRWPSVAILRDARRRRETHRSGTRLRPVQSQKET